MSATSRRKNKPPTIQFVGLDGRRHFHSERPSRKWKVCKFTHTDEWGQHWENDIYYGTVNRHRNGFFINNSAYAVIGISSNDETARHDWRDFQHIKNDIVGADWEAIELYPAESRLKDPSNRFYLWCVPHGVLAFGLPGGRSVMKASEAIAPQRPFHGEV